MCIKALLLYHTVLIVHRFIACIKTYNLCIVIVSWVYQIKVWLDKNERYLRVTLDCFCIRNSDYTYSIQSLNNMYHRYCIMALYQSLAQNVSIDKRKDCVMASIQHVSRQQEYHFMAHMYQICIVFCITYIKVICIKFVSCFVSYISKSFVSIASKKTYIT